MWGNTLCCFSCGQQGCGGCLTKGERVGNPEIRVEECKKALSILDVSEVIFCDFPDGELTVTVKAVQSLEKICAKDTPGVVLMHSVHEVHQDHRNAHWLSLSAFHSASRILAYETQQMFPSSFAQTYSVDISKHVDSELAAVQCHLSQGKSLPSALEPATRLSGFRGIQVGVQAAEAFEVTKYLEKD